MAHRIDLLRVITYAIVPLVMSSVMLYIFASSNPHASLQAIATFKGFLMRSSSYVLAGAIVLAILFMAEDAIASGAVWLIARLGLAKPFRGRRPTAPTGGAGHESARSKLSEVRQLKYALELSIVETYDTELRSANLLLCKLISFDPFVRIPQAFIELSESFRSMGAGEGDAERKAAYDDVSMALLAESTEVMGMQLARDLAYELMVVLMTFLVMLIMASVYMDRAFYCLTCTPEEVEAARQVQLGALLPLFTNALFLALVGMVYQFHRIMSSVRRLLPRASLDEGFERYLRYLYGVEKGLDAAEAEGQRVWVLREFVKHSYIFLDRAQMLREQGRPELGAIYTFAATAVGKKVEEVAASHETSYELVPRWERRERLGR